MKRENRIRKNSEFKTLIAKRQSVKNDSYIVYYSKNELKKTRIGISVSKKIAKAVIRNRIKRQIRAFIINLMKLDENIDIVIIVREGYLRHSFDENQNNLLSLIKEMK